MKKLLTSIVRWSSRWAWEKEISVTKGCAILQELSMKEGSMEVKIKQSPGLGEYVGTVFASMVAQSPNYTEMVFETHGKFDGKYEFMTVTVQKHSGKTPHQLRMQADERARGFEAQTLLLRGIVARNCKQRLAGEDAKRLYVTADDMRCSLAILNEEVAAGRVKFDEQPPAS